MVDLVNESNVAAESTFAGGSGGSGIGAIFTAAREKQHLTLEDVSNRLRLSLPQIKALETDDFAALPGAMITRGFIRNYARLLEIDPAPILAAYRQQMSSEKPQAITLQSENIQISTNKKRSWFLYILLSLVLLIGLAAWLVYIDFIPKPNLSLAPAAETAVKADNEPAQESNHAAVAEPLPEPALPLAEREADAADKQQADNSASSVTVPEAPVGAAQPVIAGPKATDAKVASNQVVTPVSLPIQAQDPVKQDPVKQDLVRQDSVKQDQDSVKSVQKLATLKLVFSDEAWVKVQDRDGKELLKKSGIAGSEDTVQGQPPLKVVVGNVGATQLIFNGKPVDLSPYTKVNVAHVTLE